MFVDDADDIGVAGMGEDGAVPQGTRAELHASPEPGDDASSREEAGDFRIDVYVAGHHVAAGCAGLGEGHLDLARRVLRTPVHVGDGCEVAHTEVAAGKECGTDGGGFITGTRHDPETIDRRAFHEEFVDLDVHEDPAGEDDGADAGPGHSLIDPCDNEFLDEALGGTGEVVETGALELVVEEVERVPGVEAGTEDQGVCGIRVDDAAQPGEDAFDILILCVGREAHDLVLVFVRFHPQENSDERIEQTKGGSPRRPSYQIQSTFTGNEDGRREVVSLPVKNQNQGIFAIEG